MVNDPATQTRPILTGMIEALFDGPRPGHYLAGWFIPSGSILEVRLAQPPQLSGPYGEQHGPEWLPVRYEARFEDLPRGAVIDARWHLLLETRNGHEEVDIVLPGSAILRWPATARIVVLSPAEYERLGSMAAQVEQSYEAIARAYDEPGSRVPDLIRRLFRMDIGNIAETRLAGRLAEQATPLSRDDIASLDRLADNLEQAVADFRRVPPEPYSESVRSTLRRESGQLLLEAGWLHDLCERVGRGGIPRHNSRNW